MFCFEQIQLVPGVDQVHQTLGQQSLEDTYFEVLSDAVSYRVRGDELIITARNGDKLYFFED